MEEILPRQWENCEVDGSEQGRAMGYRNVMVVPRTAIVVILLISMPASEVRMDIRSLARSNGKSINLIQLELQSFRCSFTITMHVVRTRIA
jgi:hypothetical protein